ncbi:ribonucleotide-diphosphate reductase subunit beta, partial [Acinetobacter baumannii]
MTYANRINDRRLILGPKDDLMAISPMKHTWAKGILDRMENNTWFPHVVNMADDVASYNRLNAADRFMFDKALAFLSNLDGIQFNNINQNIAKHVTSPEVSMCLSRQAWEEALHVKSYATIIETVSLDPMSVYMTFERDGLLAQKNQFILKQSRLLGEKFSAEGFALS